MKVKNVHSRKIQKSIPDVLEVFATLATKSDRIWPVEDWPSMRFKNGFEIGSNGGHGPIRYEIVDYNPKSHIELKFQKPTGFNGTHKFEIVKLSSKSTEIKHTLQMKTTGMGTLSWLLVIKWLHDALLEDALDKVENQLTQSKLKTEWTLWVKIWRWILKNNK